MLNLFEPLRAGADVRVIPDAKEPLLLQRLQEHLQLPQPIRILVRIADKHRLGNRYRGRDEVKEIEKTLLLVHFVCNLDARVGVSIHAGASVATDCARPVGKGIRVLRELVDHIEQGEHHLRRQLLATLLRRVGILNGVRRKVDGHVSHGRELSARRCAPAVLPRRRCTGVPRLLRRS